MRITLCIPIASRIYAVGVVLSIGGLAAHAQPCPVEIPIRVELQSEEFTLADLFPADTCPSLLHRAAQVRLGKLPRGGIARILDGVELRERLRSVAKIDRDNFAVDAVDIPQRITVTRSGMAASCQELVTRVLPNARSKVNGQETDCGLTAGVPPNARLELAKKIWDPALRSWEFIARCTEPNDCPPFLIRVPEQQDDRLSHLTDATFKRNAGGNITLYPGKKTEVIWNQNGMRLLLPGIALDQGRPGDTIRVHLKSGPIIRGTVDSSGTLSWSQ